MPVLYTHSLGYYVTCMDSEVEFILLVLTIPSYDDHNPSLIILIILIIKYIVKELSQLTHHQAMKNSMQLIVLQCSCASRDTDK